MPRKTSSTAYKSHTAKRDEDAVKRELQEDLNRLKRETQLSDAHYVPDLNESVNPPKQLPLGKTRSCQSIKSAQSASKAPVNKSPTSNKKGSKKDKVSQVIRSPEDEED